MKKITKTISKKAHVEHHPEDRQSKQMRSMQQLMKKKTARPNRGAFHGPLHWFPEKNRPS